jgi:hypothetical protein
MSAHGDLSTEVPLYGVCKWCCMRRNWAQSLCGSTYLSRCTLGYPWCWSSRCHSSSPDNSLPRTSRSRQPAAQRKGEWVCVENWGPSSMGEGPKVKNSSITSSELQLGSYHPNIVRATVENLWRGRWWPRWSDLGWLWWGGLVSRRRLVESRT